ncbi:PAS domain-containing protein, partial [Pseudomonadota bacterium]
MKLRVKVISVVMFVSVLMAVVIGALGEYTLKSAMYDRLEKEGEFIVNSLKDELTSDLIGLDMVSVHDEIDNIVEHNEHVKYMFVIGSDGELISHTFENGFPNYIDTWLDESSNNQESISYLRDVGETIQKGELFDGGVIARLYIGMDSRDIEAYITQLNQYFLIAAVVVVITSMIMAIFLSRRIVSPLNYITSQIEAFGRGAKIDFDEIGDKWNDDLEVNNLSRTFRKMVYEREISIDNLRKSEKSLAKAQEIAGLGNWDWDIENNTLSWSEGIYSLFGLNSEDFPATYEAFLEAVHPEDRDKVESAVNASLLDKCTPYNID